MVRCPPNAVRLPGVGLVKDMDISANLADHGVAPVIAIDDADAALPLVDAAGNWKTIVRNAAKGVARVREFRGR